MKAYKAYITLICVFLSYSSLAQSWSIGGMSGLSGYLGDVNPNFTFKLHSDKVALGGFLRCHINDYTRLRLHTVYGYLSGSDFESRSAWRIDRGYSFKTRFAEFAGVVEWDISNTIWRLFSTDRYPSISIYTFLGAGFARIDPVVDFNESNKRLADVNPDKLARYNHMPLIMPMGVGIEWHLTPKITLGLEGGLRKAFSDYVDGISKTAQPKLKDWYFLGMGTLAYKLEWGGHSFSNRYHLKKTKVKCFRFK